MEDSITKKTPEVFNEVRIGERTIYYRESISHKTTTYFSFKDRMRILFGKPLIINSEIYTDKKDIHVHASESTPYVPPLINKRHRGMVSQNDFASV